MASAREDYITLVDILSGKVDAFSVKDDKSHKRWIVPSLHDTCHTYTSRKRRRERLSGVR